MWMQYASEWKVIHIPPSSLILKKTHAWWILNNLEEFGGVKEEGATCFYQYNMEMSSYITVNIRTALWTP